MTRILIVEDDQQLRTAVLRDLLHKGYDVTAATSVADALGRLDEKGFDVVVTDLRMGEQDGIDLMIGLARKAPSTRTILMSAYATAADHQRATDLGAIQVLCKPFTSKQLLSAVQQAIECESGFRGNLHGLSLVDILQMFHFARRSVTIEVGGSGGGQIHLRSGEVVHVVLGDQVGRDAFRAILALPSGSLRTRALEVDRVSITDSFQSLLLDALRESDEKNRSIRPEEDFFDATFASVPPVTSSRRGALAAGTLNEICSKVLSAVEGSLACVVVSVEERCTLACAGEHLPLSEEQMAQFVLAYFEGDAVRRLIEVTDAPSGANGTREIRVTSKNNHHLVTHIGKGEHLAVLVTRRDANVGLSWAYLRAAAVEMGRCLSP